PLWNTTLLPLLFLVSALSTGFMAIILSTLGTGLLSSQSEAFRFLMRGEQILVVLEGMVLYFFLFKRYKAAEQGKDSVRLLLFGDLKLIFWGGIVVLGFAFPLILEMIASFSSGDVTLIFIAGVLLLCGGFFLRLGVLYSGIKDRIPMIRLMEIQYELAKHPKS
ncbi:MAG: NrfD/PsrC family molybdoenzyme membrane anchor subunit, partial [Thermodesulfobacteriota bacterium]